MFRAKLEPIVLDFEFVWNVEAAAAVAVAGGSAAAVVVAAADVCVRNTKATASKQQAGGRIYIGWSYFYCIYIW